MTSRRRFLGTAAYLAGLAATSVEAEEPRLGPPAAKRVTATDNYYGTIVSDPYQWMEDSKDPHFLPWLKAQDTYTRSFLAQIPGRAALRARVSALSGDLSVTKKDVQLVRIV